ncbi:MAG: amidohydrolase family protein [Pseudomonadota bacterium]
MTRRFFFILITLCFSFNVYSESIHFINAKGYTLADKGEMRSFSEMLISDDKIVAIGNDLKPQNESKTVNLQNKVMLPGIIDAHGHLIGLGENLTRVDLRNATSEENAVKLIENFIGNEGASNGSKWVIGRGWNQVTWDGNNGFPTKASLDKAFPDRPVYLTRIDGHAAWVNSKALELAGITSSSISPPGGEIIKDKNGEATGVLIDNAMYPVETLIPATTVDDLIYQLNTAQAHLLSLGITSMHDAGIGQTVRNIFINRAEKGLLNLRIYAMLAATDPNIDLMLQEGHFEDEQGFLSIRSVKAYGDGALGSRGAALLAPYSDDPDNSGLLVTKEEQLPTLFDLVVGNDFQLNFHAIGDRANRLALYHFKQAFEQFPDNDQRHRIEHAQVVAVEDIPLFVKYGVIPSMQPTHATSDMNMAEDRIGADRLKGAYAWQTFLQQGSRIAFGSDFPVELANPFHGLHAAVTRQDSNMLPTGGWIAEESISIEQAFRAFTLDAAYAAFQEDIIGTLAVGKKADFIVIDRDIFNIPPTEIRSTQVLQTWVNGQLVYMAEQGAGIE